MPFQSIYPFIASVGVLVAAIGISAIDADWTHPGMHLKLGVTLAGGVIAFIGIYLWSLEGADGYHLHLDAEGHAHKDDHSAKH